MWIVKVPLSRPYTFIVLALLILLAAATLLSAPENQSLVNPFKTSEVKDFNLWFSLIAIVAGVYGAGAWQGTAGFNCSAASAHEQKMGGILGNWRGLVFEVMQTLLAICALTYMTHPDFSNGSGQVNQMLAQIKGGGPYLQEQMRVAHERGLPPMRPLFVDFPADQSAWDVEDEFLLGPDVLVAPILAAGATTRASRSPTS